MSNIWIASFLPMTGFLYTLIFCVFWFASQARNDDYVCRHCEERSKPEKIVIILFSTTCMAEWGLAMTVARAVIARNEAIQRTE